jgi:hypothetical protein
MFGYLIFFCVCVLVGILSSRTAIILAILHRPPDKIPLFLVFDLLLFDAVPQIGPHGANQCKGYSSDDNQDWPVTCSGDSVLPGSYPLKQGQQLRELVSGHGYRLPLG